MKDKFTPDQERYLNAVSDAFDVLPKTDPNSGEKLDGADAISNGLHEVYIIYRRLDLITPELRAQITSILKEGGITKVTFEG